MPAFAVQTFEIDILEFDELRLNEPDAALAIVTAVVSVVILLAPELIDKEEIADGLAPMVKLPALPCVRVRLAAVEIKTVLLELAPSGLIVRIAALTESELDPVI